MDYYLISTSAYDRSPAGVLVEEFVLCEDFTAAGIDSAEWGSETGEWLAAPEVSRAIRANGALRSRVTPVSRQDARDAYAYLGGGELPEEDRLREHFRRRQPLPTSSPLHLGSAPAKARRYRILFAGELGADGLAAAQAALRLEPTGDARVVGKASGSVSGHGFTWELRRIGAGIAWCVDVTVRLGAGPLATLGALLHHHRQAIREQGLIPVTVERFA
ncbi:hypothetical protein ETD86_04530 [Nonomuraea turkmeniaca]|uniref:Uncharacterized protein n=1 Tax=Nonomuraea turkmeniaca TaxID=103838 RepID=A0A5S4FVM3_9ACTN|nr:hypothetical protein [Nonomuraea turkmeniaca]TMR24404.1 hypothetical protein ETD86_04530 [Nonomuraea turkmeniaca]